MNTICWLIVVAGAFLGGVVIGGSGIEHYNEKRVLFIAKHLGMTINDKIGTSGLLDRIVGFLERKEADHERGDT